jgi:dihydrolipoamide dehydrogenase
MNEHHVDVAILGAGTAGMAAYRAATAHTGRVLLIEAERYGTTCARVGCMPSKLLIAAADAAHAVREAHRFGAHRAEPAAVDGAAVMRRVREERDRFVGFVVRAAEGFPAAQRLHGRARFVADGVLETDSDRIHARSVVIATGSRPRMLPMFTGLGDRLVVNDDVFSWHDLPPSVAVFGAGVIGLELGQALHRLGVRVRLFGAGGLIGPLTDPEVRFAAEQAIAAEVPFLPDARVRRLRRVADGVAVTFEQAGVEVTEHFAYVLAATGRVPNVDAIGLDVLDPAPAAGRGVPAYDPSTLRVGDGRLFIAGDANADLPLLHEAADEGRIAGDNAARLALGLPMVRGARRSPLSVVFSDPQIAMVGQTHAQLREQDIVTGRVSFDDQGRSRVMLQNRGRLHVYADARSGRFLGAEMAGPRAEHIGHLLAWAHQQALTVDQMLAMPFYHPVIEEGLRTALRDAAASLAARDAA